tara:strand:+ start:41 stop:307 length:267 start_codon:yes stop_codon:yes gene_type:complete
MPRYLIFEKTRTYDYKFKGSSSGANGDKAIKSMKMRGTTISNRGIYIAVPTTQFMKYQLNPILTKKVTRGKKTGIKMTDNTITWKKPK